MGADHTPIFRIHLPATSGDFVICQHGFGGGLSAEYLYTQGDDGRSPKRFVGVTGVILVPGRNITNCLYLLADPAQRCYYQRIKT